MKDVLVVLSLVLALGAGGVAGYGFFQQNRQVESLNRAIDGLRSRLDATENTAQQLRARTQEISDSSVTPQMVERDMADLRDKVSSMTTKVEKHDLAISEMAEAGRNRTAQVAKLSRMVQNAPAGSSGSGVRKEDIEELIEEKIKNRQPMGKEPPLSAVAARLDLTETERNTLETILRQKKNEMMVLLKTPRPDGGNVLDDFADKIIDVMATGDEQKGKKVFVELFQRLAAEKVPGTDKTYLANILTMQEATRGAFKEALSENQFKTFEALRIENPMDIKIPNDPLGLYLQERAQASGAIPGEGK